MAERKRTNTKLKIIERRKGSVNIHKSTVDEKTIFKSCVVEALSMMRDGYSNLYIKDHLRKTKKGSTHDTVIDTIISLATIEIKNSQFTKAKELIPIHIDRYNRQIKRLIETKEINEDEVDGEDITWEQFWNARNRKIAAYSDCINTMIQKEKLLQYHNKDFVIEYNVEETVEVRDVKPKIDISKLTLEEQVELYQLFKKAKKDENELLSVIQTNSEAKQVTVDVEHQEVERPNVEQIKQIKLPEPPYRSPVTASDPTVKLRETLAKLAAKRIQEVGGNLTDEEKKLLD